MSSLSHFEYYFPFLFLNISSSSPTLSLELVLGLFLFVSIFSFWLAPGGLAWALSKASLHQNSSKKAIPGPSGWPIIGMVFAFTGSLTHRVLAKASNSTKAKSLMAFSVGFTRFIISSHPDTAKEILNSSAFADRPIKESAYELLFHRAMGFAPFGEYWRNLRRISSTHLFSPKRVASFGGFRREIGLKMVEEINGVMVRDGEVEVRRVLHFGSLNNVMMSVFGRSYEFGDQLISSSNHEDNEVFNTNNNNKINGHELEGLVSEGYELLGIFNWSDHFPVLGWLDLQGVRRRCKSLVARVNVFVGKIIEEHRIHRSENNNNNNNKEEGGLEDGSSSDFVDVLLDLQKENKLSDSDMIAVLWEMIFRGTDTVTILLEWILARMALHPDVQARAQSEIDRLVAGPTRPISDSDLHDLPYTRAIVKETLRLHPPGPLLSWARLAVHDTRVGPHEVPAGTTAMVNMWAIARDPEFWPDPEEFRPERFMGWSEDCHKGTVVTNIMGSDLRLAPFGAGRRVCPGKAMGLAAVELWLAQLLQSFKWVPGNGGVVDLSEKLKLSLEMKSSLVCKALPRV